MDISILNQNYYELAKTFDLSDPNIMRKYVHGLTTADGCFSIANSLLMNKNEREFIYACGLLHDIGRMAQWTNFASFSDTKTRPHEQLAVDILKNKWIKRFFENEYQQDIALQLIKHHTTPYVGKDANMNKYLPILRNADNYANLQYTATGLQRLWVNQNGVTPAVLAKFRLRQNLHGTPIHTKLDRILQFLSRAYAIDYNMLKRDMLGRKYINAIYDVYSESLNKEDKELLYKECWNLKRELANEVLKHDEIKNEAIKQGEKIK